MTDAADRKKKAAALALLFVDHGVRLVQVANSLTDEQKKRLQRLAAALAALILATDFSDSRDVRLTIAKARDLVSNAYAQMAGDATAGAQDLANTEARFVVSMVNRVLGEEALRQPRLRVTEPEFHGVPVARWWQAQADDTAARVATLLRGARPDVDVNDLADLLTAATGPLSVAGRHAETLIHTTVQRVAMDARNVTLKANGQVVEGLQIVATLDSHTCAQCLAYDGATYDLSGNPTGNTSLPFNGGPPYHANCRCATVPVLTGIEPAPSPTAEDWLDARTEAEQDDILGKGRAALYRRGSLTLRDLVSKTGQQLSLADLSEKYNTNP